MHKAAEQAFPTETVTLPSSLKPKWDDSVDKSYVSLSAREVDRAEESVTKDVVLSCMDFVHRFFRGQLPVSHPLVLLTGPPGCGKTVTSLELERLLWEEYDREGLVVPLWIDCSAAQRLNGNFAGCVRRAADTYALESASTPGFRRSESDEQYYVAILDGWGDLVGVEDKTLAEAVEWDEWAPGRLCVICTCRKDSYLRISSRQRLRGGFDRAQLKFELGDFDEPEIGHWVTQETGVSVS